MAFKLFKSCGNRHNGLTCYAYISKSFIDNCRCSIFSPKHTVYVSDNRGLCTSSVFNKHESSEKLTNNCENHHTNDLDNVHITEESVNTPNAVKNAQTPSVKVQKMRQSLRQLHQLPDYVDYDKPYSETGHTSLGTLDSSKTGHAQDVDNESQNFLDSSKSSIQEIQDKFDFLNKKSSSKDYEKVLETSFGFVRMDKGIGKRGRNRTENDSLKNESSSGVSPTENVFDEQYFGDLENSISYGKSNESKDSFIEESRTSKSIHQNSPSSQQNQGEELQQGNIFDQEYFGNIKKGQIDSKEAIEISDPMSNDKNSKSKSGDASGQNFFDDNYFSSAAEKEIGTETINFDQANENQQTKAENHKDLNEFDQFYFPEMSHSKSTPPEQENTLAHEAESESIQNMPKDIHIKRVTKQEQRQTSKVKADVKNPKTAYDMAVKIRFEKRKRNLEENGNDKQGDKPDPVPREAKWTGKTDSRGFRILSNQVLDIQNMPTSVVVNILQDSIIYEDESLIAIDKPYGLPSHGGPGVHNSIGQLLQPLAKRVMKSSNPEALQLVHRLDKETTGVMLLAKNLKAHHILRTLFKKRRIIKKYWVITKGIPNPTQGVIDIPIAEGTVGDLFRMTLAPRYTEDDRLMLQTTQFSGPSGAEDAVTNYRVMDSNNSAALVECQPETGVKHQIRCHMAFALNTPILGDHKYSHYSKMAPQKLYPDILHRLGIRQAKVRHLAMHLHAQQIVLPEFSNGQNLFISARLPKHFVQNMKWLQLSPKKT